VHSPAKPAKSTVTSSPPSAEPPPWKVTVSPVSSARGVVAEESRSFGPWRSNSSPRQRSARSAAARTSLARRSRSSGSPWEQLMRAQSMPAATRRSSTAGSSVAGPSVATIFVRRAVITRVASHAAQGPGRVRFPLMPDLVSACCQ
jgi:hypothetical protein